MRSFLCNAFQLAALPCEKQKGQKVVLSLAKQELLKQCMSQLQEDSSRIESLESHLKDLGQYPAYEPPTQPAAVRLAMASEIQ